MKDLCPSFFKIMNDRLLKLDYFNTFIQFDLATNTYNISISSLSDIDVVNITQKLLKFDSVVYLSAKKFFCLYYNVVEENGYSTMNLCVELFKDGALYLRRETNEQHY